MHHRSVDAIECHFFVEDFWGDYYFEAISKGIVEFKTIIDSTRKFILQKKSKTGNNSLSKRGNGNEMKYSRQAIIT